MIISFVKGYKQVFYSRIHVVYSYINILYFFEVIYLMISLSFIYGKNKALVAGGLGAVLLTFHIIMLYLRKKKSRLIQLLLMEIHGAYSLPYCAGLMFRGFYGTPLDHLFLANRAFLLLMECAGIWFFTDERAQRHFSF